MEHEEKLNIKNKREYVEYISMRNVLEFTLVENLNVLTLMGITALVVLLFINLIFPNHHTDTIVGYQSTDHSRFFAILLPFILTFFIWEYIFINTIKFIINIVIFFLNLIRK